MSRANEHWLDAFARAFPLRAPCAFDSCLTTLTPSAAPDCADLAAELDEELRRRSRGLSLDSVRLIRERAWFGEAPAVPRALSLSDHVCRFADEILEDAGGRCVPRERPDGDAGAQMERYRWATLALPVDLLIAAAARDVPVQAHVEILSPELAELLRREGVAETHVHQNAAQDFAHLWARTMGAHTTLKRSAVSKVPFGSLQCLDTWLTIARVARVVLAWRLNHPEGTLVESIESLIARLVPGEERRWTREIVRRLRCLVRSDRSAPEPLPRLVVDGLTAPLSARPPEPLRALLGGHSEVEAELRLMYRGLRELRGEEAALFWQYQRIRTQTFAWLVQDPGTAGLGWFTEHFLRLKVLPKPEHTFRDARELEGRGVRLVSLEVRKGWPDDLQECWRMMRDAAETALEGLEVGVVLHFLKNDACELPSENPGTCYRFGDWFEKQLRMLDRLESALERRPWLALFVRGYDVASQELEAPTWVVAPLFRRARELGRTAALSLTRADPTLPRADFRATAHAGEEFRALGEGLRRIDEVIEHAGFRRGDRLGHALALGADPRDWAKDRPDVLQPVQERMQDLAWELDLRQRGKIAADGGRIAFLERSLRDLLCERMAIDGDATWALELRCQLFDPRALAAVRYPTRPTRFHARYERLDRYLSDDACVRRGRAPVSVRCDASEIAALIELRGYVWRQVADRGLTIETNLSSNLLIGDMRAIDGHPARAFRHPPDGLPPLAISANDDDPITFCTSLPDELAYVYAQRLGRGEGTAEALRGIDEIREAALASRFTLDLSRREALLRALGPA